MVTDEATTVGKNNVLHWNHTTLAGLEGWVGLFLTFMQFPRKVVGASRLGNSGSAAAVSVHFGKTVRKMFPRHMKGTT